MAERVKRRRDTTLPGVLAVPETKNVKTGPVAVTYAAQVTCPAACPFRGSGCYAEYGPTGLRTMDVNRTGRGLTPSQVARNEAKAVDRLPADRDLRLHVVGDCRTAGAAAVLAKAARRYVERAYARHRRRVKAWSYSHGFRTIPRAAWGDVSVLASCESPADVRLAWERGYAAALVVSEFRGEKTYEVGGVKVVPCPAQTRGRTCVECRLCMDDHKLHARRIAVAFEAHGTGKKRVSLKVVG